MSHLNLGKKEQNISRQPQAAVSALGTRGNYVTGFLQRYLVITFLPPLLEASAICSTWMVKKYNNRIKNKP